MSQRTTLGSPSRCGHMSGAYSALWTGAFHKGRVIASCYNGATSKDVYYPYFCFEGRHRSPPVLKGARLCLSLDHLVLSNFYSLRYNNS